ncbi:MAG: hypothetical protein KKB34_12115 [Bacteroidetes bacterium]|nr:hypothetical protein [Bacteroidota bacterium]
MNLFSENIKNKLKTYLPWAGLTLLTISLMIYFKYNSQGYDSIQNKGERLISKYTGNLFPLFVKSELTNEDVFNFALYNILPIDKENNRSLKLESDSYGNENFVVSKIKAEKPTENFNLFKTKLNLNLSEQKQIDSILSSYKEALYSSILMNNEETVALDPKISLLHKAIGVDIYNFSSDKLSENGALPKKKNYAVENRDKLLAALNKDESKNTRDYIFLTPDTVFSYSFSIDKKKMIEDLRKIDQSKGKYVNNYSNDIGIVSKNTKVLFSPSKHKNKEFIYKLDSNFSKLTIPTSYYSNKKYPDYDSLRISLGNLAEDIAAFEFGIKNYNKGIKFIISGSDGNKKEKVELDLNLENLGSFISNTVTAATKSADYDWDKFGTKMDSLSKVFEALENDSNSVIKLKKVTEDLKKAKEAMRVKKSNNP